MNPRVAIAFCVHHKPWLMMATLITTLVQDYQDFDIFFLYQVGDGTNLTRPGYSEYHRLAAEWGEDPQLSPFDDRVRDVTRLRRGNVYALEFENDTALDSGAWLKFLQSGAWAPYDHVLCLGEGTLLTSPSFLSAAVHLAASHGAQCIASGHEKRRLPKDLFLDHHVRRNPSAATVMDKFHDRMTQRVFEMFSRDEAFRRLFDDWGSDFPPQTQDHVPDIWSRSASMQRLRNAANRREETGGGLMRAVTPIARDLFARLDSWRAAAALRTGREAAVGRPDTADSWIHVDGQRRRLTDVVTPSEQDGIHFHREAGPEWFGCATNHFFTKEFLTRLTERLERHGLYEVMDVPFAGTALEVVWGFAPAWLGYDKWYTDGIHRVRKHFVTYRREDDPEGMASYINRYFAGTLQVAAAGDYLKIRRMGGDRQRLQDVLPAIYFE